MQRQTQTAMASQTSIQPFDRLCDLYGIASEYTDQLQRQVVVTRKTRLALLRAMSVNVSSTADALRALEEHEDHAWRRVLPPVQVVREDTQPIPILLTLPAAHSRRQYQWTLTPENGERLQERFPPDRLAATDSRTIAGDAWVRYRIDLPHSPATGYHGFTLGEENGPVLASMSLVVAPGTCYQPAALSGDGRVWGPALQLYALRSRRNWGIGDYTDLKNAVEFCARSGAAILGVNPLHALYPSHPGHVSPYSPSSRLFLNSLYLDMEAMADFAECSAARNRVAAPGFQERLVALRAAALVDYAGVASAKLDILDLLYRHFREQHLAHDTSRARQFRAFQSNGGDALRHQALFDALQEHFHGRDPSLRGWPTWPAAYQDPASAVVLEFNSSHQQRVEFFQYLQWQAEQQLQAVGERSLQLGLGVGLYQDLAISVDPGGAEAWANQALYAREASIGSPADELATRGQDWGLPPMIPERLTDAAYRPFIATLRANMHHAGALRIDHVMGLMRLFCIPAGASAKEGTYVSYPFDDLLGILALESQRNQCMVIGEDLGNVPQEVREKLGPLGVLSYRLLYFERGPDGGFRRPADYPRNAVVAVGTHDLPTLSGFWQGRDLDVRTKLGLFPSMAYRAQQVVNRSQDRAWLLTALETEGLLPPDASVHPISMPTMSLAMAQAVHVYLARTPAKVMVVQGEDLLDQAEQVNLPVTTDAYPNWQHKLPLDLEDWTEDERVTAITQAIRKVRPASPQPKAKAAGWSVRTRIPRATYRLQFNRDFTFAQATELVPYLATLGVSHVYASPYLKARPGSTHGYDIIDHNTFNPEIGTEEDFERFVTTLHAHRMGQILDMVPNHMGVMGADNTWWLDLLENGPASVHADYFDIDWEPLNEELNGKVLLPLLGDQYGAVLDRGELRLTFDSERGEFSIMYYDHRFPVDPREYPRIISHGLDRLGDRLGTSHPFLLELQSLVTAFGHLPERSAIAPELIAERSRDKETHKRHLAELCVRSPEIARFIAENVAEISGVPGIPASFDTLHEIIKAQAYRLAYWRVAADDINYRRFFDINDLAALRMENEQVFETTHRLVLRLLHEGKVDALRIDHPDGLYDPAQYFQRLQGHFSGAVDDPARQQAGQVRPIYLVIEKILAGYERLPEDWPVHGTTGYRFANVLNGLFVDTSAETKMDRIYAAFIGETIAFDELLYRAKRLIMGVALSSELNVLANLLSRIAQADRHTCDFTLNALRSALAEVVACFPVYRTYVSPERVRAEDRRYIDWAVSVAKRRSRAVETSVFDFLREVLVTSIADGKNDRYRFMVVRFAMKFQQFTGPVMAKGMEDTSFYRYNRLVSLNEVGGDPRAFGMTLNAFHGAAQDRARYWPHTMLSTSTHDGKRSEDVRVRINVLSEMPAGWRLSLRRWSRMNRSKKRSVDDSPAPSRNDEYLLYQTLLGAWPLHEPDEQEFAALRDRIQQYMLKAVREAKVHTSWINPDPAYEDALAKFVDSLLGAREKNPFLADFLPAQKLIARFGMLNSLSQTLIKLTSPGVPDIYQGTELWDFSLVDPDNRRPVDYARRRAMLDEVQARATATAAKLAPYALELTGTMADGRIKLYLTWRILQLRRERSDLFESGAYHPLTMVGQKAEHVCAYARQNGTEAILVVAPRFFARLVGNFDADPMAPSLWEDTRVELPADYVDCAHASVFTAEALEPVRENGKLYLLMSTLLAHFPVALVHATRSPETIRS